MERAQIPYPLQTKILTHIALALFSLVVGILFLIFFTCMAAFPFLLLAAIVAGNGCRLYHIAVTGHYLVLSATVLKVERTAILHHPKAIPIESEGKALRVMLHSQHKVPDEGSRIVFYIQDSTPIYEWHGIHLMDSYLVFTADNSEFSAPL